MAVVGTAALRPDTGDGEFEAGKYVLRQKYLVRTNNLLDDATVVVGALGLPPLFTSYSAAVPNLRARRYSPKRLIPGSLFWEVGVEWSTPDLKNGGGGGGGGGGSDPGGTGVEKDGQLEDPTIEIPEVSFGESQREELITQVYDATTGALKPPTTSNGELIDPPPKRTRSFCTLEISRNEPLSANHPALGVQYGKAINADVFWGLPAGSWQCKSITAKRMVRQLPGGLTVAYLKATYRFEASDTWDLVMLDYGTYYLRANPAGGATMAAQTVDFQTARGQSTAAPLNGQGGALARNLPCSFDFTSDEITVVPGTSGVELSDGQIVQFSNIGGSLPSGILGSILPNVAYYVVTAAGNSFRVSRTAGGGAISFGNNGTGQSYVSQPAVYNTIRPYPWLPFANLGLPQSFADVQ
jgi:hypothetical protein